MRLSIVGVRLRRALTVIGVLVAIVLFACLFYKQTYIQVTDRDTCDIAQVARNIADGQGFTTRFIRPFNAGLLEADYVNNEVNHAPLFPYALSVLFRLKGAGDQTAVWPCLIFFCLTVVATCLLGRMLFDWRTGLLAATVFGTSAPLLQAGTSGSEWPMAAFWLVLLLCAVAAHHRSSTGVRAGRPLLWSGTAGALLALLYYTNQVLIFLMIPLAVYFAVTGSRRRLHFIAFVLVSLLLIAPWAYRNYQLTGFPVLGANAWEVASNTNAFPGESFFRSSDPANRHISTVLLFPINHFAAFIWKLAGRSMDIVRAIIPMLGLVGMPFAVVGMLYRFKSAQANALRGLTYAMAPILVASFAIFNVSTGAVVALAPLAAVLGAAYFLLLVDAKKLHSFYAKVLIAGFVLVTAAEALTFIAFPMGDRRTNIEAAADTYFAALGQKGMASTFYTDVPWIAAWRIKSTAIWLPETDKDALAISAKNITAQVVILTPESDKYAKSEAWYAMHRIRLWREYITNPDVAANEIFKQAAITGDKAEAYRKYLKRIKRSFAVADMLTDMTILRQDPLVTDDIQIYVLGRPDK